MISPKFFVESLAGLDMDFFAGVPDSLLKSLCAYITEHVRPENHIIAANEGNAVGLAVGYHLATGKIPVVYMQNSGEGNVVNPLLSLADKEVYHIPLLLLVGWRGEPGVKDEPQHVKQGKVTVSLLETLGIEHAILSQDRGEAFEQLQKAVRYMHETWEPFALIIRKGIFEDYTLGEQPGTELTLSREKAIQLVAASMDREAVVVSTTGMISRELFEFREASAEGHHRDFLTVGSMGHASQIALGIALQQKGRKVYCFDGDGAVLMHMGGMGVIGSLAPGNFVHVVFNNGAHDSVGGQPTVGFSISLPTIAEGCGYRMVISVSDEGALCQALEEIKGMEGPLLLEVAVKKGARKDLGRPTTTPIQNKEAFMNFLREKCE